MSEIKCPKCNKSYLLLVIEHTYIFSLKEIGMEDVIPQEKIDAEGTKYLKCEYCNWRGWTDQYWSIKEGIVPLFDEFTEGINEDID